MVVLALFVVDCTNPWLFCVHFPFHGGTLCGKLKRGSGSFMLLGFASWLGNKKLPRLRQFVFIKGTISFALHLRHRSGRKWHCK